MDRKLQRLSYRVTLRTTSRNNRMIRVGRGLKHHLVKYTKMCMPQRMGQFYYFGPSPRLYNSTNKDALKNS